MNENTPRRGMDMVVKVIAHRLKGFIFLFGAYLVVSSHHSPGGGFAGGVVIACSLILLTLAEGQQVALKTVGKTVAAGLGGVGALLLLAIFAAGMLPAELKAVILPSGVGLMQLCDVCIGVVVSMLLFVVFSILAATHIEEKAGKRRMIMRGRD